MLEAGAGRITFGPFPHTASFARPVQTLRPLPRLLTPLRHLFQMFLE